MGDLTEQHSIAGGSTMYTWEVKNPINNYCIIPYIGKYVHFNEIYKGEKGNLRNGLLGTGLQLGKSEKTICRCYHE